MKYRKKYVKMFKEGKIVLENDNSNEFYGFLGSLDEECGSYYTRSVYYYVGKDRIEDSPSFESLPYDTRIVPFRKFLKKKNKSKKITDWPPTFNYVTKEEDCYIQPRPKLTKMPKYFIVERNNNNPLWKEYIAWMNKKYVTWWNGNLYLFYGFDGSWDFGGTSSSYRVNSFENNPTLLTLEEWNRLKHTASEEKEEFTPTNFKKPLGFVTNSGDKGYFVYTGGGDTLGAGTYSAVSNKSAAGVSNTSYGDSGDNNYTDPPKPGTMLKGTILILKTYHQFETPKELHKWLSE